MNLGNLIKRKMVKSEYSNMKELYEAMQEILGDQCCAYNTFTDYLNKNKRLSDLELLTLAALLGIDLNKVANHFVNSRKSGDRIMKTSECYKSILNDLICILNYKSEEKYPNCYFKYDDIELFNNKIYALTISTKNNSVLAYEIEANTFSSDDYTLKIKLIAYFDYLNSILDKNDLTVDTFREMEFLDKINLLKEEGSLYYDLFEEEAPIEETLQIQEYYNSVIDQIIKGFIDENGDKISIDRNGAIHLSYHGVIDKYYINDKFEAKFRRDIIEVPYNDKRYEYCDNRLSECCKEFLDSKESKVDNE